MCDSIVGKIFLYLWDADEYGVVRMSTVPISLRIGIRFSKGIENGNFLVPASFGLKLSGEVKRIPPGPLQLSESKRRLYRSINIFLYLWDADEYGAVRMSTVQISLRIGIRFSKGIEKCFSSMERTEAQTGDGSHLVNIPIP
jgi:hypothetical protein